MSARSTYVGKEVARSSCKDASRDLMMMMMI